MLALLKKLRRHTAEAKPTEPPVPITYRYTYEVEVMVAGQHGYKLAELIKWPTRDDCLEAQFHTEPVMFTVRFSGKDYSTDIPVYVWNCYENRPGSIIVNGATGPDESGLQLSVSYDFADMSRTRDINPDQPRLIMYKED